MPKLYIAAATQISIQQPLSEEWMTAPLKYTDLYVRSIDPNFREWLNPIESRRMGKLMKRALVTALKVMNDTGITQPEAIITGTGLGCIENTEVLLNQLCLEGEEMLKPTSFMQSTHNTLSSLIAIQTHCHGYNSTYSHRSVSFDAALLDAFTQLRLGDIRTALVTGNDELTPSYFKILRRTGYVGQPGQVPATEASVAMMLTTEATGALCEVEQVSQVWSAHPTTFCILDTDAFDTIVLGTNGCPKNDALYEQIARQFPNVPCVEYKRLFGECYTVSALGVYAAAHIVHKGKARRLLFVNHSNGRNITFIILKSAKQ